MDTFNLPQNTREEKMFEFEFGLKEEIIVATIALLAFGHKKLWDVGKKLKRFVTE